MTDTDRFYRVIEKPVISEKATDASATRNAYTFRVPRDANKVEIRGAVEKLFEVKVRSVNTLRVKGKWKRVGRGYGRTKDWKKAVVVLDEGQTIDVL